MTEAYTDDDEDYPVIMETAANGTIRWTMNGMDHRKDAPAIIRSDGEAWCQYGYLHRVDGPAVTYTGANSEWWIHGDPINSYEELQDTMGYNDEDIVALKLKWGKIIPCY